MIDDWKLTTRGIADYLLRPGDLDGLHRTVAAECVIRLSGYTNHGVELYSRFRPTAQAIGDAIWVRHGIKLPYIKIPEPWTATIPNEDHDGLRNACGPRANPSDHKARRRDSGWLVRFAARRLHSCGRCLASLGQRLERHQRSLGKRPCDLVAAV